MKFQSTFPRGERRELHAVYTEGTEISIHVPAWGTTCFRFSLESFNPISIHVPAWGTTQVFQYCKDGLRFQSTFPRGERQRPQSKQAQEQDISIHVPAWGTTFQILLKLLHLIISIHVPAWGTTNSRICREVLLDNFNPRSRVGNDCIPGCKRYSYGNFNPRSRVGNDRKT